VETSVRFSQGEFEKERGISDMVEVEAVVNGFIPNAMRDEFESGVSSSFDATQLQILAPAQWRGNKLTIYHSESPTLTSPWREINRKLRFSIREDDLKADHFLFDGAIRNLHD
jgi:hypothetical protein